jgi:UDP-N-acetylmuramoylalanine--D-glutamate ligase
MTPVRGGVAGRERDDRRPRALIEGFGPDAVGLGRLLASEGGDVRLAGPGRGPEPGAAAELRDLGIRVEPHADLDADPGPADVAYLDPWTPETAPRVRRLRARGVRISCLGDVLLERWQGPTVGITGTAGKTSTTALVAEILRRAGIDVAVSRGARAGNLWPTADLLGRLRPGGDPPLLLLELTSSHLAFMRHSPGVAAVISFWPDHLELHGDLGRYRAAKETIVREQRPGDVVVVNADDASAGFAAATPADLVEVSLRRSVARGAFLDPERGVVLADGSGERALGHLERCVAHPGNAVAAAAVAAAAGAGAAAIADGIRSAPAPRWRAQPSGSLRGAPVIDDGMAATPAKTMATLSGHAGGSVILIAGGLNDAGGGPVHAAPEERVLLERACDEIARVASHVLLFGEAGSRLAVLLRGRGVDVAEVADLAEAVERAAGAASRGSSVVFSPAFPVSLEDRGRFAGLVRQVG